ncbi:MAG TPA: adenylate/guanylate cyclase domain-containing protein [Burkholderiales bacterium]|nr:adenylate/guanylate cyclase domain-containing protein [Burkholderiales bacterium]
MPGKTQTILIVDDTQENILLLSEVLESDYMTKAAIDGERALKIAFAAEPPDLILLDVMMPGMSGYEVCKRLKENPNTSHIPVIFVTAMGEVEDETKGLELGAVDYITKPISPPIVMARVKTHLERYEQKRELQQMVVKLEEQARELEAWNQKLEQRVAEGVAQLDRLGRMKRFFSPAVADLILAGNADDPLKTHRREIVVVFLDMRGFTTFSESADPEEVMSVLAEYHAAMGELITKHAGTLERFTGDGIMIFFNDPVPVPNPARQAVSMALEMQQRFKGLAAAWARRGYELSLGIGIAQGYATIGAIGFEGRRDYGAIGNVTNLAARLCGEAQGGQILVSQRVEGVLGDMAKSQPIGDVSLKGFNKPIKAFEICWNI